MRKKPILAKKSLLRGALLFYGNNFVKKKIKLIHDGTLSELQPPYIVLANHCSFVDKNDVSSLRKFCGKRNANCAVAQTNHAHGNFAQKTVYVGHVVAFFDTVLFATQSSRGNLSRGKTFGGRRTQHN